MHSNQRQIHRLGKRWGEKQEEKDKRKKFKKRKFGVIWVTVCYEKGC